MMDTTIPVPAPHGIMQRIYDRFHGKKAKKKGAILSFDSTNYLLVLIIFIGLGVIGLAGLEGFRIVSAKFEMKDIATSCATYQNLRIDHAAVTDIKTLVNPNIISASDSVDGAAHGQFLKKTDRWNGSRMVDPWGQEYTFDGKQIICQGGINGEMREDVAAGLDSTTP